MAAEARAKGISLSEIQIDYDCPESKLDDYRGLLPGLREAAAPVPVTFTALPSWMGQRRAFSRLIAAADGYVLQVHSLTPPADPKSEFHLLKPGETRELDRRRRPASDARSGWPSPPTATSRPSIPEGSSWVSRRKGRSSPGRRGAAPRRCAAIPRDLAELVRDWTRDRPRKLAGILWYRLPVAGDRMNWAAPALRAVMAGRTPRGAVRADRSRARAGAGRDRPVQQRGRRGCRAALRLGRMEGRSLPRSGWTGRISGGSRTERGSGSHGPEPRACAPASAGRSPGCASRPGRRSTLSYRGKLARAVSSSFSCSSPAPSRSGPAAPSSPTGSSTTRAGSSKRPRSGCATPSSRCRPPSRLRPGGRGREGPRSSRRRRPTGKISRPPSRGSRRRNGRR